MPNYLIIGFVVAGIYFLITFGVVVYAKTQWWKDKEKPKHWADW